MHATSYKQEYKQEHEYNIKIYSCLYLFIFLTFSIKSSSINSSINHCYKLYLLFQLARHAHLISTLQPSTQSKPPRRISDRAPSPDHLSFHYPQSSQPTNTFLLRTFHASQRHTVTRPGHPVIGQPFSIHYLFQPPRGLCKCKCKLYGILCTT